MTEFQYVRSTNQDDPTPPRERFEVGQFLAGLPAPTTERGDYTAREGDPAFEWVDLPSVFPYRSSLPGLRSRFPAFQFDYATPKGGRVTTGKYAGQPGFRIRVRHDPHR